MNHETKGTWQPRTTGTDMTMDRRTLWREKTMKYATLLLGFLALVLATSAAFAGKGDRPYYCPASVSAAGSWAQPECAGASEYLRKRLRIGDF